MSVLDDMRALAKRANPNMKVLEEKPEDKGAFLKAMNKGLSYTVFPSMVNSVREGGVVGAAQDLSGALQKGITGAVGGIVPRPDETPKRPAPEPLTTAAPVRNLRGGFVGSETDAEAARNLQARFAQDEAARGVAAGYDRAVERLRDLRATKLGISRNYLDQYEGRAETPQAAPEPVNPFAMPGDKYGDDVFRENRLKAAMEAPGLTKAQRAAASDVYNSYLERAKPQPQRGGQTGVDPVDMGRFLLDQQKFGYQQQADKRNYALGQEDLANKKAGTQLESQRYADTRRKEFLDTFSYPDENAPREQLGAMVLQMSDATGGIIPPEVMTGYIQKAAEAANVDWKNAPPTSLKALTEEAMRLAKLDYGA
jgi:hypothetical protein